VILTAGAGAFRRLFCKAMPRPPAWWLGAAASHDSTTSSAFCTPRSRASSAPTASTRTPLSSANGQPGPLQRDLTADGGAFGHHAGPKQGAISRAQG
jgi:hypothetical protein